MADLKMDFSIKKMLLVAVLSGCAQGVFAQMRWAGEPKPLDCTQYETTACAQQPAPAPKKPLDAKNKSRFHACREAAAKNPTDTGVRLAYRLCQEKFQQ